MILYVFFVFIILIRFYEMIRNVVGLFLEDYCYNIKKIFLVCNLEMLLLVKFYGRKIKLRVLIFIRYKKKYD